MTRRRRQIMVGVAMEALPDNGGLEDPNVEITALTILPQERNRYALLTARVPSG